MGGGMGGGMEGGMGGGMGVSIPRRLLFMTFSVKYSIIQYLIVVVHHFSTGWISRRWHGRRHGGMKQ